MFCPHCGKNIPNFHKFCPKCGGEIKFQKHSGQSSSEHRDQCVPDQNERLSMQQQVQNSPQNQAGLSQYWIKAILITIGLLFVTLVIPFGQLFCLIMVIGSAGWAAMDSEKRNIRVYQTPFSGPWVVFIAICLLWILFFPWYLVTRSKIIDGSLPFKNEITI